VRLFYPDLTSRVLTAFFCAVLSGAASGRPAVSLYDVVVSPVATLSYVQSLASLIRITCPWSESAPVRL
jgi:hypothetical protein